jgi:flagellar motor protein MotB
MKEVLARGNGGQSDEENPYWISFSDIMSGLLIIFIMAVLALILALAEQREEVDQVIEEQQRAEQARRDIVREVVVELGKRGIVVEVSDNEAVVRIPDSLLAFETNEYFIPDQHEIQSAAFEIGAVLHSAISRNDRWKLVDTIFVEGHTDRRSSHREMGNWGLSTFRAIALWNFWDDNLPQETRLSDLLNHDGQPLFSVSGYAETRPLPGVQATERDFRKNRRIDIRFTVMRPSIEKIERIRDQLTW